MQTQIHRYDLEPPAVQRGSRKAVDVVLLSPDEQIFETTRNVIGEEHRVWRAHTHEEAMEQLVAGRCGVLVIDLGTSSLDPSGLVRQVTQQFPDVVVVATGRQTDAALLGTTISEGLVYRFMHKPLSPNRAGMFLDHAINRHAERREQSGLVQALLPTVTQLPPRVERRYWLGAAAAVLALLVALVVYLVQRETPEPPLGETRPQGAGIPPEILLSRAAAALEAGRLEAPEDDNALDLYREVLLAQPNDATAHAGLERTTGLVLAKAHAESVAGRGDEGTKGRVLQRFPVVLTRAGQEGGAQTDQGGRRCRVGTGGVIGCRDRMARVFGSLVQGQHAGGGGQRHAASRHRGHRDGCRLEGEQLRNDC